MAKKTIVENTGNPIRLGDLLIKQGINHVANLSEGDKKILTKYGCTFPSKLEVTRSEKELQKALDQANKKIQELELEIEILKEEAAKEETPKKK